MLTNRSPVAQPGNVEPLEQRTLLAATRVMPLGDSITESTGPHNSYRYYLWQSLQQDNYDVDFVGSQHGVKTGRPGDGNFDQDHEGHWGWRADEILSRAEGWARDAQPDVVLLHVGSNDILQSQANESTVNEVGQIIDALRAVNSNVAVLLAQIIPLSGRGGATADYNARLAQLAQSKHRSDSPVIIVDQNSAIATSDLYDGIHPTDAGEHKMALRWYEVLQRVLPEPDDVNPNPTPPPPGTTFLPDLAYKASNGLGPVEKNRANGEAAAGDGRAIRIRGNRYDRGFGTFANSRIDIRLNGRQKWFRSDIGIDDSAEGGGSVIFKVYADGKRIFSSKLLTGQDQLQAVRLNIKGVKRITLIVSNAGDGAFDDRANWANARVTL